MSVWERESASVCVRVCVREGECECVRESVWESASVWESGRERVRVCGRERVGECERVCGRECVGE